MLLISYNKRKVKNENRQKKRSRQILQRSLEDEDYQQASIGDQLERDQGSRERGMGSLGQGGQSRAGGTGSFRRMESK